MELKRQPIEVSQIVTRAIEMASPLLEKRQHKLAVAVPTRGLMVYADPARMAQVLSNLLTNAAKYTEGGGQIWMAAARSDGEIVVRVKDSGIGIAADILPRVFAMFVQERQALDRSQGGLGLGLTIARSLVALHGGRVEARSEGRNRGAEFIVRLPALSVLRAGLPGAPERAEAPVGVDANGSGRRILVVDDNEDAAELLAAALDAAGHVARVAHDGPGALQIAEQPGLQQVRLVAVTGYGHAEDRRRSEEAGFGAHLVKPVHVDRLRAMLETL